MDIAVTFSSPAARSPAARTPTAAADELIKPLAMVADGDEKIRAAVSEILRRAGFRIEPVTKAAVVLDRAKQHVPAILVLDAALPGVDVAGTLRVIARCRETRPVRVIVAFPPEASPIHLQAAREAGAFATLLRPLKSRDIVIAAMAALKSSEEERAKLDAALRGKPPVAQHVASNNSLLVRTIACPFHPEPVRFDRYTLRGNRIQTDSNFFDIAVYTRAAPKADFVNFHQLAVMVCPRCLFASNSAEYFNDPDAEGEGKQHAHSRATLEAIAISTAERCELMKRRMGDPSGRFFDENRTVVEAMVAYELALHSSKLLVAHGRGRIPAEYLRAGNYYLRLAHLHELAGAPPETMEACYTAAVPLLEQAYTVAEGSHLFKAAYQMIALSVHFGEDKIAHQYLSQMLEFERDERLPDDERGALQRYLPRARRVWEDRESHRSALLEKAG